MGTRVAPRVHVAPPSERSEAATLARGERLGRYELLFPIASGGMGQVWAAEQHGQLGFRRVVAIKVIRRELALDADARRMFLREAEVASRIRHVNVVETLDLGVEGETVYLAMPFVMGVPLSAIAKDARARGGIPVPIVLSIAIGLLRGLHAAHVLADEETGVPLHLVHRDVSPQNVLVGEDGVAKLSDFGIAMPFHDNEPNDAVVKGKPRYVAPEQLDGAAPSVSSDIFSAGAVLWEALAGEPLFDVSTRADGFAARRTAKVRALDEIDGVNAPEGVARACARALSRRAEDRFASAKEMADALEATGGIATHTTTAEWLDQTCGERLRQMRASIRAAKGGDVAVDAGAEAETTESDGAATVMNTVVLVPSAPRRPPFRFRRAAWLAVAVPAAIGLAVLLRWQSRAANAPAPALAAPLESSAASSADPTDLPAAPASASASAAPRPKPRTAPRDKPVSSPRPAQGAKPLFESPYK